MGEEATMEDVPLARPLRTGDREGLGSGAFQQKTGI
jgi:hypothetical protein